MHMETWSSSAVLLLAGYRNASVTSLLFILSFLLNIKKIFIQSLSKVKKSFDP
jgi:hypothetical protein